MILAALLTAATRPAGVEAMALGTLARQELPAKGCAAFLWTTGPGHALIAMVGADPAMLRVSIDTMLVDLPLTVRRDVAPLGFARSADYAGGTTTITLDMDVRLQSDLKDGARIPAATVTITRPGRDVMVVPAAGLIGCAPS